MVTSELLQTAPAEAALVTAGYSVTVLPYQSQGLFALQRSDYYTTEASGDIAITVTRTQVSATVIYDQIGVDISTDAATYVYACSAVSMRADRGTLRAATP
jgi:hypothetical protein